MAITLQQGVLLFLLENGMAEQQAYIIIGQLSATQAVAWSSTNYAPSELARLRQSAQSAGLKWIKDNAPDAWFRPMFEDG